MSGLRFPNWQCALQEAVLETRPDKLQERIKDLERIMSARRTRLDRDSDMLEERQALDDAARLLRLLEKSFQEGAGSAVDCPNGSVAT